MFEIKNNEKNKSSVILNPEAGVKISEASVEPVVNDGAKTKRYSAKRDLYGDFACAQPLKMTALAFLLSLNLSTAFADTCECVSDGNTLTIKGCSAISDSSCADKKGTANNIRIGTGVTSIGHRAFANASSLTSITIPDSVTSIGNNAFEGAKSLTSITIPDSVTSIGSGAFNGASSLTSITIPEKVTSIGDDAFRNATNLTSITIPEGVTSIGDNAFFNTGLTSITIPDGVTSIGMGAFVNAGSLESITIPDSVTSIGSFAFDGVTNIICKGDGASCVATTDALDRSHYTGSIFYTEDETSCEGSDISLFVWDDINGKCRRRNEKECNSVAKYYYSDEKCQVLPKTKSACTGTNIEWNATDNKCVNKNYTPPQEDNNGNTGGDVSGDFNPADCYNKGQVPYNNQCVNEYPFAKKRWTPAEANEWLHDGNDNFVVITFKK